MAKAGDKLTKDSAPDIFKELGIEYHCTKNVGTAKVGDQKESWTWTTAGLIPPRASKVRALLKTVVSYRKAYKIEDPKPSTGKGAVAVTRKSTGTTSRANKTEAAYWHGYTVEVLDQITSAIAEAKATAKQRQRAETARRTVEGLEELGLPVSDELRTLADSADAEIITALFGDTGKVETPAAETPAADAEK